MHPRSLRFALGVAAACAAAVTLRAVPGQTPPPAQTPQTGQSQQTQEPQQPTFRAGANLVRVDVYPMKDGAPVRDLTKQDFQVFEDGVPQAVQTFEHVVVRPAGASGVAPVEPNSQREGNQMAADPHNRVFVIFLDTYHVRVGGSHNIRKPLIDLIDRVLGPDDLVGVMTPEMPADGIILARKTDVIKRALTENWVWGRRDAHSRLDPQEQEYEACYPTGPGDGTRSKVAEEMIERRRERLTLESIRDTIQYLDAIREERKFVLAVSDGWRLFPPDSDRLLYPYGPNSKHNPPRPPTVGITSEGRIATEDPNNPDTYSHCEKDRLNLAHADDQRYFRDILREADRANTTFYTIDPRGLPAFDSSLGDTSLGASNIYTPSEDASLLRGRLDSLRELAANTDGMAVLNNNDIDTGLRKVVGDLTSVLPARLLLDQPEAGREVPADRGKDRPPRRGRARPARLPGAVGRGDRGGHHGPRGAHAGVGGARGGRFGARAAGAAPARHRALGRGGAPRGRRTTRLRIVGEMPIGVARRDPWRRGGEATVLVTGAGGATLATGHATLAAGAWTFATDLPLNGAGDTPQCRVEVRLSPAGGGVPVGQILKVALPGQTPPVLGEPVLFRRGPTTGTAYLPAADTRFVRADRLRLEAPVAVEATGLAARLLDCTGQPLAVPVAVSERTDNGQRWLVANVAFAPLAKGDYVLELSAVAGEKTERTLVAVRVVS